MYLGKVISFGNGLHKRMKVDGFIKAYGSEEKIYFHIDDVNYDSRLRRTLLSGGIEGRPVAFDTMEDRLEPLRKIAINIRLAYECDQKTFEQDVDKSQMDNPEVIELVEQMRPADIKQKLAIQNAQKQEAEKNEKKNLLFAHLCDVSLWESLTEEQQIETIIEASYDIEQVKSKKSEIKNTVYAYEKKKPKLFATAVLMFLLGGTIQKEEPIRKQWMEFAHDKLIRSLTLSYAKENCFSPAQIAFLPSCFLELKTFCDARNRISSREKSVYCLMGTPCNNYISTTAISCLHFERVKKKAELPDFRDLLHNIDFEITDLEIEDPDSFLIEDSEYPYRVAAYANRLKEIRPYLVCSVCGDILYPDLSRNNNSTVYSLVYFRCEKGHDNRTYINHCDKCGQTHSITTIIDSRECKHTAGEVGAKRQKSKYLCMRCGGGGTIEPKAVCPNCLSKNIRHTNKPYIECLDCGHDGSYFGIYPRPEKRKPVNNTINYDLIGTPWE